MSNKNITQVKEIKEDQNTILQETVQSRKVHNKNKIKY